LNLSPPTSLVLDALNVLHAWGEMRAKVILLDALIEKLAKQCLPLCDAKGWELWLAIDQRQGKRREEQPRALPGVTLAFADPATTADGLIEHRLLHAKSPQIVVSDDAAIQRATLAAHHELWTPPMLANEIRGQQQRRTQQLTRKAHGPLGQSLFD